MVTPIPNQSKKRRVRISKSGQITLPSEVRKHLGVDVGEHVDIRVSESGRVTIEAFTPLTIEEFAGVAGPPPDVKTLTQYLEEVDRTPMVRSAYDHGRNQEDSD